MKMSRQIKVLLLILALVAVAHGQQKISGSYTMVMAGQNVSEEHFTLTIDPNGQMQSEADVTAGAVTLHMITKATKNAAVSFTAMAQDKLAISTTYSDGSAKITGAGQPDRDVKTNATVTLENGVWHQLIFLLKQYDETKGGTQKFTALLPSQAREISLEIEPPKPETFTVNGTRMTLDHYKVNTGEGLVIDLWTDRDRVPKLIAVFSQGIRVVSKGSEELELAVFPHAPEKPESKFTSEDVLFNNGDVKLAGTLTLPKTGRVPFPAAVIITGSGSQNRDGITVLGLYRLIAESLSNAGVAVLRVDDRGVGRSTMPDPKQPTSYRDLINDSRAAVDFLRKRNDIDKTRIALVGHSEGAETALTMAAEDPEIAAIVLLAGAAHPLDQLAVEQSFYQQALQRTTDPSDRSELPALAQSIIDHFEQARASKAPATGPDAEAWYREHLNSDPSALARRVKCPVLILNGERDELVLPHNALDLAHALILGGNRDVRLRIFPNLTHLFAPASVDNGASPEQLSIVSAEMLRTVSDWTAKTLAKDR